MVWLPIAAVVGLFVVGAIGQESTEPAPGATLRLSVAAPPEATPAFRAPAGFQPTPVPPFKDPFYTGERAAVPGMGQVAGYLVLLLALFAGGIYVLRNGVPDLRMGAKTICKLNIEETRSLGRRQFLVVAEYEGQRLLLGVCPGRIDRLCVLKSAEPSVFPNIAPELEERDDARALAVESSPLLRGARVGPRNDGDGPLDR